ncbi:uncharacterized protein SCHCODRAFT_02321207 [Schizophyllum commune H4-8]|uniref:uncharacterized protein n=1 Tax=Schizophyllum commune (strain H4-8 / FGSC 9210) TaxID=578458 RepID=UPI00215EDB48|nr:uncharacterized protein SCHCODRAFT_02321207 [Schizophyllum commune H4-8]KAI5891497.1 hypothetical protein SCHCODRAFT_02321207 [Schizophyllum commune H4-8]
MHDLVWLVLSNGQFALQNGASLFASESTIRNALVGTCAAIGALLYNGIEPAGDNAQRAPTELVVPLLEELATDINLDEDAGERSDKAGIRTIVSMQPINLDEMCTANAQDTPPRTLRLPTCDAAGNSDFIPDVSILLPAPFPDLKTQSYTLPTNKTVPDFHTSDYINPFVLALFILGFVFVCTSIVLARRILHSYFQRIAQAVMKEASDPPISSASPDAPTSAVSRSLSTTAVADKDCIVPLANTPEELKDTKASFPPTYGASPRHEKVAMFSAVPPDVKTLLGKNGRAEQLVYHDEEIDRSGGEDLSVSSAPPAGAVELAHVAPSEDGPPAHGPDEQRALNDTVQSGNKVDEYAPAQDHVAIPDVPKDVALPGQVDMRVSSTVDDAPMLSVEAPALQRTWEVTLSLPPDASVFVHNEEQLVAPTMMQMIARPRRLATLPRIVTCENLLADEENLLADEENLLADEENVPANEEGVLPDGQDALNVARPLLVGSPPSEHNDKPGMVYFEYASSDEKGIARRWRALIGAWDHQAFDRRRFLFELLVMICRVFVAAQRGSRDVAVVFRMLFIELRDSRPAQCWLLVDLRGLQSGQRGLSMREHSVPLAMDRPRLGVQPLVRRALLVESALHEHVVPSLSSAYMSASDVFVLFASRRLALVKLRVISLEAGPAEDTDDEEDAYAEADADDEEGAEARADTDDEEDANGEEDANDKENVGDQAEAAPLQAPIEHVPMQQDEDAPMGNHTGGEGAGLMRWAPRPLRLLQRHATAAPVGDHAQGNDHPRRHPADEVPRAQHRVGGPRHPEEPVITPANSEEELQLECSGRLHGSGVGKVVNALNEAVKPVSKELQLRTRKSTSTAILEVLLPTMPAIRLMLFSQWTTQPARSLNLSYPLVMRPSDR